MGNLEHTRYYEQLSWGTWSILGALREHVKLMISYLVFGVCYFGRNLNICSKLSISQCFDGLCQILVLIFYFSIQFVLFGEIVLAQKVMYEKFGDDFLVHFVSKGFSSAHCPPDLAEQYRQKLQVFKVYGAEMLIVYFYSPGEIIKNH